MELILDRTYSREEIREAVGGGDLQSYLPHKDGRVLCGCFTLELNARAPFEIDVGYRPEVVKYARVLVAEGESIPVFLKKDTSAWEYAGRYRPVALSEDPFDLYPHKPRRRDAVAVIYLEPADTAPVGDVTDDPSVTTMTALEGGRNLVEHFRRERNRALTEAKRRSFRHERGALACEACELAESSLPVELAEACFEVHHLVPLSERAVAQHTRLDDLALLCANCHRLIHHASPMPSVDTLRQRLRGCRLDPT